MFGYKKGELPNQTKSSQVKAQSLTFKRSLEQLKKLNRSFPSLIYAKFSALPRFHTRFTLTSKQASVLQYKTIRKALKSRDRAKLLKKR